MTQLEVIVPVYNEAENISNLFFRLDKVLSEAKIDYKVIFVDDNSTDDTVREINKLPKTRVQLLIKKQKKGKAFSILEGLESSNAPIVAMIDGDLQYPPEAIPEMFKKLESDPNLGMVVANRKSSKASRLRRILSRVNRFLVGKLLLGFNFDIQSGLKVFRHGIASFIDPKKVTGWSLDVPLLHMTHELGYQISQVDIDFAKREKGQTKVKVLEVASQILLNGISTRLAKRKIYHLPSENEDSMIGAGVAYKKRRFTTHTTLHHSRSAITVLNSWQKYGILALLIGFAALFFQWPLPTAIALVAILSTIYFIDTVFNLFLVLKSLHFPPEISFSSERLQALKPSALPVYSILCPLYKEAGVLPHFLDSIDKLDWPKEKLDVLLLLEQDDQESIDIISKMDLPKYIRTIVVPDSQPKTKPKACNYGLAFVKGEYVVIYDAEDRPDADQLKKAYLGFQNVSLNVGCLQAKLNYYNPHHNLLTRLFTAEYSLWFDVILTGLQSIETAIPLGGTSNHFRTETLRRLEGWDPFNVTEDCDLGIRLFKYGYKTAIIDSTTLEEANSKVGNWIRQRSRWIKGYIQTYLVQMRNPFELVRTQGWHALLFQLTVGGKIAFIFINPFLWVATIAYFTLYKFVGPTIESLYPPTVFYMAVSSLVFGNFFFLYYYMIGCAKREHWSVIKYVFLIPIYWLMVSVAGFKALIQLIYKPHYWEKTNHGLSLKQVIAKETVAELKASEEVEEFGLIARIKNSVLVSGGLLITATILANFFNFLYNAYLSRSGSVSIEDFGVISLFGSLLEIIQVPSQAIAKTVTYRMAFMLGKHDTVVKRFWKFVRVRIFYLAILATAIWVVSIPLLTKYFNIPTTLPFILFTPIWIIGALGAIDRGFLSGVQRFGILALMTVVEAVSKFIIAVGLINLGVSQFIYLSIPASIFISFAIGWFVARKVKEGVKSLEIKHALQFPAKFFATSMLTKLSSIAFLSLDVILAKIYLPPVQAGQYALISLVGKMVYFIGSLFSQFITPIVSKDEGAGKNSRNTFYKLIFLTGLATMSGFFVFGILGERVVPFLFGEKAIPIIGMLPWYTYAMVMYSVASNIVNYHQIKKQYYFPVLGFVLSVIQVILIVVFHANIESFVGIMLLLGSTYLGLVLMSHLFYPQLVVVFHNIRDFLGLFNPINDKVVPEKLNILIFNWRDTKHKWAGGAEVYLQELASRWVRDGHNVTIFCGNDGHSKMNENMDGVNVFRHGGFYTVYIWAFLYYIFKFKGKYDLVIDSENGIPFFTPFYVREPKFLLIYHVHQEMFRSKLYFPMDQIALFLETKAMPYAYKNQKIITISESSKEDILKLGLGSSENISIITPGIDITKFAPSKKAVLPLFSYVGRIRPQKNVDIAIKAFAILLKKFSNSKLVIGGWGENLDELKTLVRDLKIEKSVEILGRITEEERKRVMSKSWAMLQPSSFEGWGITVIEANASGTPVIGSNVTGLRDSIVHGETGILVPVRDENSLARAMEEIIKKPSMLNKMEKNAYSWSNNFSWDASSGKFAGVLNKRLIEKYKLNQLKFSLEEK